MKKEREESFIGETSLRIYEKLKNLGKYTHPVGALIPPNQSHEWDELRNIFEKYGVKMSKGGLMLTIKWALVLLKATCPTAEKTGYDPIGLTDCMVNRYAKSIEAMDVEKWVDQSGNLRKEITKGIETQILVNVKKKIQ